MSKLLLAIAGRVEEGETLSAMVFNTGTGTSALTGFSLQWQALVGGTWTNTGSTNSLTLVVPAGTVGRAYRLVSTASSPTDESSLSAATLPSTKDGSARAPTLADVAASVTAVEGATGTLLDAAVTFDDADNQNYGGGRLTVLNSNAASAGGDGRDVLALRNQGTGAGQVSFNAATGDVSYSTKAGQPVVIGRVDAVQNGAGTDFAINFNTSATKVAVDKVIENLVWGNTDDSPAVARLLTIRVADGTGGSVQRVIQANVTPAADAPLITSAASFGIDENTTAVGVVQASDPDREAGAPQGITYSLVGGTGSTDNALFAIDAATGQLWFLAAPDFEGAHAPSYAVRVRASDANGGVVEQAITVQVRNVNEAPQVQAIAATAQEDGGAVTLAASFSDPDAGDALTITFATSGTQGSVALAGTTFTYQPGGLFQQLALGTTATDTFSYTVTDAAGLTASSTATLTIVGRNDAPVAQAVTATLAEDAVSVELQAAFSDIDAGDQHVLTVNAAGLQGSVTVNGTKLQYSPDGRFDHLPAGASAIESFTYTVTDAAGATSTSTATITVTGSNDAPVAQDITASIGEDGASVALQAAFSDVDAGDQHAITLDTTGTQGTVTQSGGSFTYSPGGRFEHLAQGASATDVFSYTVTDAGGLAETRTATMTIVGANDAASVAGVGSVEIREDESLSTLVGGGRLVATDPDAGESAFRPRTPASGSALIGTFEVLATGDWVYRASNSDSRIQSLPANATLTDTFVATTADGSATQLLTVTLRGVNDAPLIGGDRWVEVGAGSADASGQLRATGQLTILDIDQGERLIAARTDVQGTVGRFSVAADGRWTWSADAASAAVKALPANAIATDVFWVEGIDGTGDTAVAVQLRGVNDAPAFTGAQADGGVVREPGAGEAGIGAVSGHLNAQDPDGNAALTWSVPGTGQYGYFALSYTGDWTYTLDPSRADSLPGGAEVVDTWTVAVRDEHGATASHDVRVTVQGSNDAPITFSSGTTVYESVAADGVLALDYLGYGRGEGLFDVTESASGRLLLAVTLPEYAAGVARLLPDGTPDATFGTDGTVPLSPALQHESLSEDAQGRVLVAGSSTPMYGYGRSDATLVRLLADGSTDAGFGSGGWATIDLPGDYDHARQAWTLADGRILVVGDSSTYADPYSHTPWLARLNADGSLDASFGDGGKLFPLRESSPTRIEFLLDAQERVVLTSLAVDGNGVESVRVERVLPDGSFDPAFGAGGHVDLALGATSVHLPKSVPLADGTLIVGALGFTGSANGLVLTHVLADGSIDASFGEFGRLVVGPTNASWDVAIDGAGRLLVATGTGDWATPGDVRLERYAANGTLDTTFGNAGTAFADAGGSEYPQTVIASTSGDILVAGLAQSMAGYMSDIVVARFDAAGDLVTGFGGGTDHPVRGYTGAWDPDGGSSLLLWSGGGEGAYGTLTLSENGEWSYLLDSTRPEVDALDEGEQLSDTFTATVVDSQGAASTQEIVITIIGTYDPPGA